MPYRYLDDIAPADAAFIATGNTPAELFAAAADALMEVMVENLDAVEASRSFDIRLEAETLDMLLFRFLGELVYYKDAERLLLRAAEVNIESESRPLRLEADVYGEEIDTGKHHLAVDVKAVTLHRFKVEETPEGWRALVVLDI